MVSLELGFLPSISLFFFLSLSLSHTHRAMGKNRNQKKRNAAVSMDITEEPVSDLPQGTPSSALRRKTKEK
jgi:hypothetical protein